MKIGLCLLRVCWFVPFLTFVAGQAVPAHANTNAKLPNVIVVMADDLGIGDISPTNPDCKIKTPRLQAMANQGLTFLDAHSSSSVCTPTRYGLLTGRYNWRSRLAKGVLNGYSPHLIPSSRATVGHLLKSGGYHTAMIGKWHLGWDWQKTDGKVDFAKPVLNGPDINGFDYYYAHCGSLDMPPYVWVENGNVTSIPTREQGVTSKQDRYGWYRKGPISDDFVMEQVLPHLFEKTMTHVRARAQEKNPFFVYLALPAPHTPILPVKPFKDASGINPYADFVMQVDHHMGQLLDCLREAQVDKNTLIVFTSDNGCSPQANFDLLKTHQHDPSAGFRGHKADIYEGGHRVPMIVRWDGHIEPGSKTSALACLTDLYATFREIVSLPANNDGGEDSFSLLPVFKGAQQSQRTALVSHSISGHFAIRSGNWKLCLAHGSGGWSAPREPKAISAGLPAMQLFDLSQDPGESKNVLEANQPQQEKLLGLLQGIVSQGRSTPGEKVANDRVIEIFPQVKATQKNKRK